MNEQSAKWTEILIWKCFLLMKMYDAWTFVVKLCIRHVRLFYQYAYRALEAERETASATLCIAIKRSSWALCNSTTSRCSIAMHILAHMHTHVFTRVKVMTYCLHDIFIKRYEDIRLARTDIMCSSTDKHLLCTISSGNLRLLHYLKLSRTTFSTPPYFFSYCFCLLSCLRHDIWYGKKFYDYKNSYYSYCRERDTTHIDDVYLHVFRNNYLLKYNFMSRL